MNGLGGPRGVPGKELNQSSESCYINVFAPLLLDAATSVSSILCLDLVSLEWWRNEA